MGALLQLSDFTSSASEEAAKPQAIGFRRYELSALMTLMSKAVGAQVVTDYTINTGHDAYASFGMYKRGSRGQELYSLVVSKGFCASLQSIRYTVSENGCPVCANTNFQVIQKFCQSRLLTEQPACVPART